MAERDHQASEEFGFEARRTRAQAAKYLACVIAGSYKDALRYKRRSGSQRGACLASRSSLRTDNRISRSNWEFADIEQLDLVLASDA